MIVRKFVPIDWCAVHWLPIDEDGFCIGIDSGTACALEDPPQHFFLEYDETTR
jgi:hypothetical protein